MAADSRSKPSALGGVNIVRRVRAEKPQATYPCINGTRTGRRRCDVSRYGRRQLHGQAVFVRGVFARIRARLRRSRLPSEPLLVVDDLKPDRGERRGKRGTRAMELTSKEFALLAYRMRPGPRPAGFLEPLLMS